MKKIINTIKSNYEILIIYFLTMFIFSLVFYLGNLNISYLIMGIQILLFLLIIHISIKYIYYVKEVNVKEIIIKLEEENRILKSQISKTRKDLQEYYILWLHQIKTPITVSKLLLNSKNIDLEKLKTQILYIEEYSNMAISYTKLFDQTTDMDITEVELDKIIKPLLKKYSIIFINKGISLDYKTIDNKVISDSKWLAILIEQILSNALKYTKDGTISIVFDNEFNRLTIKDTGIGIRSEDLNKIFDKGYSGFNGRLEEKSSGLGLYLSSLISKKLNIDIDVYSKLNYGSTFSLKFNDSYNIVRFD